MGNGSLVLFENICGPDGSKSRKLFNGFSWKIDENYVLDGICGLQIPFGRGIPMRDAILSLQSGKVIPGVHLTRSTAFGIYFRTFELSSNVFTGRS